MKQFMRRALRYLTAYFNIRPLSFLLEVNMASKNAVLLGIAGTFLGVLSMGQGTGLTQTTKTLKLVPVSYSQPDSGEIMFKDYCAACHGMDGKGNGPAVEFLKAPPPDLTTMAKRLNEKSIALNVKTVLRFGTGSKAHGTLNMPVWRRMFNRVNENDTNLVYVRINNLSNYVQSIQQK